MLEQAETSLRSASGRIRVPIGATSQTIAVSRRACQLAANPEETDRI